MMSFFPKDNNVSLKKFESMLKTNNVLFFDSVEFEEIIYHYIDTGKTALAKKAIKLGLVQHPDSIMLKLIKSELLIFDGNYEEASVLLRELQSIEPNNEEIYIQQANIFSKQDDHRNAIKYLNIALEFADDAADIFAMLGMEYLFLDNFDAARINFSKSLELDFEDYSSLYNVIYCFDMENKHKEAVAYLNEYIDKDPYCEIAWHQIGRQYFILRQYKQALQAFDFAVLIDELFVGAYLEKAKTLEKLGKYEEAIENYKTTVELEDPTSFAYLRIGKCYEKLQKFSLAVKFYNKAVHEDPLLEKGWLAIIDLKIKEKKYRKALFYVQKALEIDEHNTQFLRKYAEVNLKLEFFEEAVYAFEMCLSLHDFDLSIWLGLSDIQVFLGDYEDALKTLKNAAVYFKGFAEVEYRLCGVFFKLKQSTNGIIHLKRAIKIDFEYSIIILDLFPEVFNSIEVIEIINKFKKSS